MYLISTLDFGKYIIYLFIYLLIWLIYLFIIYLFNLFIYGHRT
jgi:hypothetical protein